jgi:hypothetical protein
VAIVNGNLRVSIGWTATPDEGSAGFRQYNIYRGTTTLQSIDATQLPNYEVGATGAGELTFLDTIPANGVRYYYHVRAEKSDGTLSGASNEAVAAGREEGTGRIIEEFVSEGDSGFDLSTGLTVSLDGDNADRFDLTDLYLGTTAENDASTSPLALKSPELLARLGNDEWLAKDADIKQIGTDFDVTTTEAPGAGWANSQDAVEGNVYAIKTPSGNYAKIKILDVEGLAGARKITFKYAYQPTAGLVLF